jgi:hypothetical protein
MRDGLRHRTGPYHRPPAAIDEASVGSEYATSALYIGMITPSQASWGSGDREFLCYLYEPTDGSLTDNVPLTGSMRGSGR